MRSRTKATAKEAGEGGYGKPGHLGLAVMDSFGQGIADQELGRLAMYYDRAANGKGSVCLINGEAGRGKTRLIEELKEFIDVERAPRQEGNNMIAILSPKKSGTESKK